MIGAATKLMLAGFGIIFCQVNMSWSARAQERAPSACPIGYALIGALCISGSTGDVVEATARSVVAAPQCPPGFVRLDRYCIDLTTGDVDEPQKIGVK